ncbi:bifunctional (p)ppGpp synthetase/guanosine-3',5'-bis(diphosphate) 3'-pyrophosphohydrolase [Candidatus Saccharibacteria bacterium]|nr:bifunctional (p)ppGpp synthetase/guanosine-3',5'-bis(diphosphate) 3'-pyrophosphohydrolase [Candidatus Saccharibacteria bacterium]MBQ3476387.1 bifunctional (p)ppGpp synthetase/guanosine-3',5'-bis(diphosphate) 3'-pyrophosphohydrolase [Candidatus Saccharibacteria bacterium]
MTNKNDSERVKKAVKIATKAHEGQFRKTGEPYIVHPLAVKKILEEWGMDEDTIVAGILHDTVEDTELTLDDIKKEFGESVAFLVDGVTKLSTARNGMRDIDTYLPATKDNFLRLMIALGDDIRVLIIKLADRLHNLRTLSALPPDKQKKIAKESLEVFAPLADRLNMGLLRTEMSDLAFKYVNPRRFEELKSMIDKYNRSAEKSLKKIEDEISAALKKEKIKFTVSGRVKSVYSLHKKLAKHDQNINEIYDLIALRIIVDDITDCYLTLGVIHSLYTPMGGRIKDYIAKPKLNGYQSLHTTVITKDKRIVEFQIRTKEMHEYAERGLAASFYYNEQKVTENYKKGKIEHLPTNLLWIRDLQTTAARLREGKKVDLKKLKLNLFADKIFVYTPKGDIIDLPAGSLPLDFAYRLHSEIGDHVVGVKINGKMSNLNKKLEQGDIVEILTSKNQTPKSSWLDKIITPHARQKLLHRLHKNGADGRA